MTKIILHGCMGRMGKMIEELVRGEQDMQIVAGVDVNVRENATGADDSTQERITEKQTVTSAQFAGITEYPVYVSLADCDIPADVVIDFSNASATDSLLQACADKRMPLVLCTTGLSEDQIARVHKLSRTVPVLRSANMSLGINTLLKVLTDAAPVLCAAGFDVEVIEKHHRHKLDAPSGTALALADAVCDAVTSQQASVDHAGNDSEQQKTSVTKKAANERSAMNESAVNTFTYVCDRSKRRTERTSDEIGISSVRGGTIVGEHDVIFAGTDEVVTFSHTAYSRAIFAKGAVAAAAFLVGKEPGLYSMADVVK